MTETTTGTVEVSGAELYFERRGTGPGVVFISGGDGSAVTWWRVAELLADSHTVVTYDWRGYGRSPAPPGWSTTSVAEQAADCIGLVRALVLDRPVIVGHSMGGTILVALAQEHGREIGGALVVEPMLVCVSPSYQRFAEQATELVAAAMAAGDLGAVWETLNRWMWGDAADRQPPDVAAVTRAGADIGTAIELPAFSAFEPDAAALAACPAPVDAVHGAETGPPNEFMIEGARWVADASGGRLHVFPGAHLEGTINPARFEAALRPVLTSMHEPSAPRVS